MPFDAIFMTALAGELRDKLVGGKVDKLYQPARDEAVLHMRAGKENVRITPELEEELIKALAGYLRRPCGLVMHLKDE